MATGRSKEVDTNLAKGLPERHCPGGKVGGDRARDLVQTLPIEAILFIHAGYRLLRAQVVG